MLQELYIENLALIDRLRLELGSGLNILTGETGAGKSIIVDAMALLLGGRASQELIRTGEERALVEGFFSIVPETALSIELAELGLPPDAEGHLWLSREVSRSGRNFCRVNGRTVSLAAFQEAGRLLVDLHGQHDHQSLLSLSKQLQLLDNFSGRETMELGERVAETCQEVRAIISERQNLELDAREKVRRQDLWQFQLQEIDRARLTIGEDQELVRQKQILAGSEKLAQGTTRVYNLLYGDDGNGTSAMELLGQASVYLRDLAVIDPSLAEVSAGIDSALFYAEEAARTVRRYAEHLEHNPERLEQVEARLNTLQQLLRKYGDTIQEVLKYREEVAASLQDMENYDQRLKELEARRQAAEASYHQLANLLSEKRRHFSGELARMVSACLAELDMPRTEFMARLEPRKEINPKGAEEVEFLISPNPGEPLKPLSRIASGGELSRVMLAIKCALAGADAIPTLIFDEIDAGIGGRTARSLAIKLSALAEYHQVICVTHLAQVAAFANRHFAIAKEVAGERTRTGVRQVEGEAQLQELVRMLGGQDTPAVREHAREMLRGHSA